MAAFNSKQYAWANVTVVLGTRDIVGIRGVKYTTSQEKDYLRGVGNRPLAIQSGNISVEGSITLLQSELEFIISASKAAGFQELTQAQWDIAVAYVPSNGETGTPLAKIIKGVEFEGYEEGMEQGDLNMEIELNFKAIEVKQV